MSGGISAIKGFDYQATVILNRLFDLFDKHGLAAQARPEGIDDLDLSWTADASEYRRYEQIKKPREDREGNLKLAPWTFPEAIDELLPNTVKHLSGNSAEQIWIVGDEVDEAVSSLIDAGKNAPIAAAGPYWNAVHALARNDALGAVNLERSIRQKLLRWRVPGGLPAHPAEALSRIVTEFGDLAKNAGASENIAAQYGRMAAQLHNCLPGDPGQVLKSCPHTGPSRMSRSVSTNGWSNGIRSSVGDRKHPIPQPAGFHQRHLEATAAEIRSGGIRIRTAARLAADDPH